MKINYHNHGRKKEDKLYHSKCRFCGCEKHQKPFIRVFEQINWFRGDDEYLGVYCYNCFNNEKYKEVSNEN